MKKLYLEFVRGMAAIIVVVFHLTKLCAENSSSHIYLSNWGRDAVFIFFILSGCVINMSQALHPKPRWTFFRNRLLRLYPEFIIGVFLGLLVLHLLKQSVPSAGNILGNLFMLSTLDGFILKPIESNSPIWSLSYEMFFYLMFAFAIGRNQKKIIFCWLLISLVAIRLYFVSLHNNLADNLISLLAYSSIWLVGYYVYEYRNHFYADIYGAIISAGLLPMVSRLQLVTDIKDPLKNFLFAIIAIPLFRYCLQSEPRGKKIKISYLISLYIIIVIAFFFRSEAMIVSKVFYSLLPVCLLVLIYSIKNSAPSFKARIIHLINKTGEITGKYSYAIYIIHFPVLYFFSSFIKNPFVFVIYSLIWICLLAIGLETLFQPKIVSLFKKQRNQFTMAS